MKANLNRRWVLVPSSAPARIGGGGRVKRYSLAPTGNRRAAAAGRLGDR